MQQLPPGCEDIAPGVREGLIEALSTERAAEREQHRAIRVETEVLRGLRARRRTIERDDLLAQRHPDRLATPERRALERHAHGRGTAGPEHVGETGLGVGLVHHERHALAPRSHVGGCGCVAPESDDDIDACRRMCART